MLTPEQREKALEARRAYRREWQRNNRDKTKEYNDRYWLKKALQAEKAAEMEKGTEAI